MLCCRLPELPEEEMAPGRWHGASIRAPTRSRSRSELKQVDTSFTAFHPYIQSATFACRCCHTEQGLTDSPRAKAIRSRAELKQVVHVQFSGLL